MHDLKIEKNVPLSSRVSWSKWAGLEKEIEVGDSWYLKNKTETASCKQYLQRQKFKVVTRQEDDGFRMWCIKKPEAISGK